jgi:hypothetical protein
MAHLVLATVLIVLLALWLLGITPPYLFPAVAVLCVPGPFRRFAVATMRRLWAMLRP